MKSVIKIVENEWIRNKLGKHTIPCFLYATFTRLFLTCHVQGRASAIPHPSHPGLIRWYLGLLGQKWPLSFSSWDPIISCILRMNLWIELIFWMLIVMQWFLVTLLSYSLTFKNQRFTAILLLVFVCLLVCLLSFIICHLL